jgi:hypothetical protein
VITKLTDRARHLWWQFRETKEQAWRDGYATGSGDLEAREEEKDSFIEEQGQIIEACISVFTQADVWRQVPADLRHQLCDYV